MACQTEALDLTKPSSTSSVEEKSPSPAKDKVKTVLKEDLAVVGRKKKAEELEESENEEPSKRLRLEENSQHSNVIQWLTKNSFDTSPPGLNSSIDSADGVKTDPSPPMVPHYPSTLSPGSLPIIPPAGYPVPPSGCTVEGVTVTLQDGHLWSAFNHTGTEMIINKSGRRMFPYVTISVQGLHPNELYSLYLEVVQVDDNCYKYVNKQWAPVGVAETITTNPPVIHADSPKPGSFWMKGNINFASVKLTNTADRTAGKIFLRSMHKYMTRIHIVKGSAGVQDVTLCPTHIFSLPETSFIAVTAYKNKAVTVMKIMNNPFAKPYRESSSEAPPRARCLRKLFNAQTAEEKKEVAETKQQATPPVSVATPSPLVQPPPMLWYPPHPMPYNPASAPPPFYFPSSPMVTPYNPYLRPFDPGHMRMPVRLSL